MGGNASMWEWLEIILSSILSFLELTSPVGLKANHNVFQGSRGVDWVSNPRCPQVGDQPFLLETDLQANANQTTSRDKSGSSGSEGQTAQAQLCVSLPSTRVEERWEKKHWLLTYHVPLSVLPHKLTLVISFCRYRNRVLGLCVLTMHCTFGSLLLKSIFWREQKGTTSDW